MPPDIGPDILTVQPYPSRSHPGKLRPQLLAATITENDPAAGSITKSPSLVRRSCLGRAKPASAKQSDTNPGGGRAGGSFCLDHDNCGQMGDFHAG